MMSPLEINGNGMRKGLVKTSEERYAYPHHEFWKLASETSVKVISTVPHKPSHVNDSMGRCLSFAEDCGITYSTFEVGKSREIEGNASLSIIGGEHASSLKRDAVSR